MEPFATVSDYEERYGEVDDSDQVETLLGDASAFIAAQPGFRLLPEDDDGYALQQANLVRVTCAVVHRSLLSGDLAGLNSYSEGGVGYTASVNIYNPSGDFFLTKAEKRALGISGFMVGTIPAAIHAPCGEAVLPCG